MEEKSQNSGLLYLISLIYPCPSKKKEEGRSEVQEIQVLNLYVWITCMEPICMEFLCGNYHKSYLFMGC